MPPACERAPLLADDEGEGGDGQAEKSRAEHIYTAFKDLCQCSCCKPHADDPSQAELDQIAQSGFALSGRAAEQVVKGV